jgi:diacylglycerol kinase family enzyme
MRGLLIVNPKASTSSGWSRDVVTRALAAELDLDIQETRFRGHGIELAFNAALAGVDVILTLGGDGTINEAINGIKEFQGKAPLLGTIPGGLANVFPRALGLPPDPMGAAGELMDAILCKRTRTIPLGKFNGRWFGFNAGIGLDAGVVQAVEAARERGSKASPARYLAEGVRHYLSELDSIDPHLSIQAHTRSGELIEVKDAHMMIVQNTSPWSFVGPVALEFAENAAFDRGLEAVALMDMAPVALAAYLAEASLGIPQDKRSNSVAMADCSYIKVSSDWPMPAQVDGDALGLIRSAEIELVPNALEVLVPA